MLPILSSVSENTDWRFRPVEQPSDDWRGTLSFVWHSQSAELTILVSCKSLRSHQWTIMTQFWCAVWSWGVMWPYFLKDEDGQATIVTSQCCADTINEFLDPKLPPNHNLWFQQAGATAHKAMIKHGCTSLFLSTAGDFLLQWLRVGQT